MTDITLGNTIQNGNTFDTSDMHRIIRSEDSPSQVGFNSAGIQSTITVA